MYINVIKELIKKRKTSQKEVANLIPISERQLGQSLMNGDMKVSTLIRIAEILKVPVTSFFNEKNEHKENDIPSSDNEKEGFVTISINELTYLKNLNKTLQKLNNKLEEEVNKLKSNRESHKSA